MYYCYWETIAIAQFCHYCYCYWLLLLISDLPELLLLIEKFSIDQLWKVPLILKNYCYCPFLALLLLPLFGTIAKGLSELLLLLLISDLPELLLLIEKFSIDHLCQRVSYKWNYLDGIFDTHSHVIKMCWLFSLLHIAYIAHTHFRNVVTFIWQATTYNFGDVWTILQLWSSLHNTHSLE